MKRESEGGNPPGLLVLGACRWQALSIASTATLQCSGLQAGEEKSKKCTQQVGVGVVRSGWLG